MHVIVIGSGPAGISAALYARRGGAAVTVITKGEGALASAEEIENYYGFAEPISGAELEQRGIAGAKRIGVVFETDVVMSICLLDTEAGFLVEGVQRNYKGGAVVLAAGTQRKTITVPGVREFEGRGISYCAICDAFFYRNKRVAVIGAGDYALHEAQYLLPHVVQLSLLTNGEMPLVDVPEDIVLDTRKISRIVGERRVRQVLFTDGTSIDVDGIFMAVGTAGSMDLARKIGVLLDDGKIIVGKHMETNVSGIYAAGDCTGGLLQIVKACYDGAEAGLAAVRYLRGQ